MTSPILKYFVAKIKQLAHLLPAVYFQDENTEYFML